MAAVLIQGASRGIGLALAFLAADRGDTVFATCRKPERATALLELRRRHTNRVRIVRLDVTEESTIQEASEMVAAETDRLHLLMNVGGILHDDVIAPERRVVECRPEALGRAFAVNAVGPLLVAKHFAALLRHDERAVLANVSARVGSIEDNRLGGWYAYRASKAAQNMFTKNLSIELTRKAEHLVVIALHPGTVNTDLSKPFQRSVPKSKLFSVERAAEQLLGIAGSVTTRDNGSFIAWDGSKIPW